MTVTIIQMLAIMLVTRIGRTNSFTTKYRDNYLPLRPLIQHWTKMHTHPRRITVIFDDPTDANDPYIPSEIFRDLGSAVSIATLEHLLSLDINNNGTFEFRSVETGNCVILLCADISDIRRVLESPHLSSFWHPENFYILRETVQDPNNLNDNLNERFLAWALERLWQHRRIYKIAVSIGSKLIRYDPFEFENHKGGLASELEKSETSIILSIEEQSKADVSRYCRDYRESFDLYPLRISIFRTPTMPKIAGQFGGLDYKYLEAITRKMNVTTKLVESSQLYGWKDEDDVFRGTLGDLIYKRADVSFNQFFVKDYETDQLQIAAPITSDRLCLVVPRASPIPQHLVIVQTFSPDTWLLILMGYLALSLVYTLMKHEFTDYLNECGDPVKERTSLEYEGRSLIGQEKWVEMGGHYEIISIPETTLQGVDRKRSNRKEDSASEWVCGLEIKEGSRRWKRSSGFRTPRNGGLLTLGKYLARVILQMVQPLQNARRRTSERVLLICSLIMSLILGGLFTSELTSHFTKVSYYEDLHSLEDVDVAGIKLLTESRDLMDDALTDPDWKVLAHLRRKLEYANQTEVFRRLFDNGEVGALQRKGTMALKFTKSQRDKIHAVEECPRQYNAAHLILKGSPFFLRINTLVGWLNSAGFYDKWYHDMSVELKHLSDDDELPEIRLKLTMRHLAIPFIILFIGILCSGVAFICERKRGASIPRHNAGGAASRMRGSCCRWA